jgi:hypothetical protein
MNKKLLSAEYNNNVNILSDTLHNLFNTTARGIEYWRKHRQHICYKCRRYGHIAVDCTKICELCGNLHNDSVCVHNLNKFYWKIQKILTNNIIKDPEKIAEKIKILQQSFHVEITADNKRSYRGLTKRNPCSFTITPSTEQHDSDDDIIDPDEEDSFTVIKNVITKKGKTIKRIVEFQYTEYPEVQQSLSHGQLSTHFTEYTLPKPKTTYPTVAQLEYEVRLDNLVSKRNKAEKLYNSYQDYLKNKHKIASMKRDIDELIILKQEKKIDYQNFRDRLNSIKDKAYRRIKNAENKLDKKKNEFYRKKEAFYQKKDKWHLNLQSEHNKRGKNKNKYCRQHGNLNCKSCSFWKRHKYWYY